MLKILKAMFLEEWRIHAIMFGNRSFSFFPLVMVVLAFTGSIFLPLYLELLTRFHLAFSIHVIFLFFGLSVGGFGMFGQEALNRRLGDISLVAYASRTLPVSERRLFANFVVKDTVMYLLFIVVPFYAAYLPARILLGLSLGGVALLYATVGLSFMFGLSVSFLLSTAYVRFGKSILSLLMVAVFSYTLHDPDWMSVEGLVVFFPPLQYFLTQNPTYLLLSAALTLILSLLALCFFRSEYRLSISRYQNQHKWLTRKLGWSRYAPFLAKDLLDLHRSEGGLAKIAVSYVFPLSMMAILVSFFTNFLPVEDYHFMLIMVIMIGVVSTSLYNWLSEFDFPELYLFLPLPASYIIKSKLILHAGTTFAVGSISLLSVFLYLNPPLWSLGVGYLLAFVIASYCVAVMVYLTGLHPNTMMYSAKVLVWFLALLLPPLVIPIIGFMSGFLTETPSILISLTYTILLTPVAYLLLDKSYVKWDLQENLF